MDRAGKKVLVACYSRSGFTRGIAELIHAQVGGDLFEIEMAEPYSSDNEECQKRAELEMKNKTWPRLAGELKDPGSWDTIFIGYPIWWSTMPPPLFAFLNRYDFSGKTLIPFCTYGGSGVGHGAEDIAAFVPDSRVSDVLGVKTSDAKNAQKAISEWLSRAGFAR